MDTATGIRFLCLLIGVVGLGIFYENREDGWIYLVCALIAGVGFLYTIPF